ARLLLLVDARLHAVVADAVTGAGDHRIVDADHRQRAQRPSFRAQLVEFGNALLERTAGERHAERRALERRHRTVRRLLFAQAGRARILLLLVTPDAIVGLVESAREIGAGVGQREAVAPPPMVVRQAEAVDALLAVVLDRDQAQVIELARRLEQHAGTVPRLAGRRLRRPRGIAKRQVEIGAVRG